MGSNSGRWRHGLRATGLVGSRRSSLADQVTRVPAGGCVEFADCIFESR
jgi:hypothetical protein